MRVNEILQLGLFLAVLLLATKPTGIYLLRILDAEGKTFLDPVVKPLERRLYRLFGVDPRREQSWSAYAASLLAFSLVGLLLTYAVLRLQRFLPLNPQKFGPVPPDLAFNTAASFATNTNWQNYGGESTLSYFSQMAGLVFHNFVSAAVGIAVAAALVRGLARRAAKTVGNFWVDLVRLNLYLFLPLGLVFSIFLISQGTIQNFKPYQVFRPVDPVVASERAKAPAIAQGPVASQVAIKMLGTNGGGFFNANAAHPYENPTPLSNFFQMLSIFLIPSGLTYFFGRTVRHQRHGWAVWGAMAILFVGAVVLGAGAERSGNSRLRALGLDPAGGNMEGKEVRFGVFPSILFAVITTDASCGAVNSMHDSFTPLGGLVLLLNIQLGEVVFGGVGAGLFGMLVFVIVAVFLTGLMVGRTPEYLGKKIEPFDVKASVLVVMIPIFAILGFAAWAAASRAGLAGVTNGGPHGLSQILYAFSSAAGNNGSAFAGLSGNTPWYNVTLAVAMLLGRLLPIVMVLALAGNMAKKKTVPAGAGSFPVGGATFVLVLVGTVLIVGALTFLPVLALGPIVEHFLMMGSNALF